MNAIKLKYTEERVKRHHPDGLQQYIIDLGASDQYKRFQKDPWCQHDNSKQASSDPLSSASADCVQRAALEDGNSCVFLIIGAGYGGILFAANLIKAGVDPNDIRLVDTAMGFGGTWYWNRYPGIQCDVESYIYMPLLEDTGYIPTLKYSFGTELRAHAERIALHFGFHDKAQFGTRVDELAWDDDSSEWVAKLQIERDNRQMFVRSKFVLTAYGIGHYPKLPNVPGLDSFSGAAFHTSRWDYDITGGTEADPKLTGLADKRVGIVGTGATAVQAVPYLARWAKQLYVFQRTPSSVGPRNNKPTDPELWKSEVATHPGWQTDRAENFNAFLSNALIRPEADLVDDEWTKLPSYSALIGSPTNESLQSRDEIAKYVATLEQMDLPRQEKARSRVDKLIKEQETAEALKPWYPSWCKRPCFNDDYLDAFNQDNVVLVTTGARGIERINSHSVIVNGDKYDVDVLIFATGFRPPTSGSPAERSRMKVYGRKGLDMDAKWAQPPGLSTLHGLMSRGFPNFFFPGPNQMGAAPNGTYQRDQLGRHFAYIATSVSEKLDQKQLLLQEQKVSKYGKYNVVVEPLREAEDEWAESVAKNAAKLAAMGGCTPNYMIVPKDQEADTQQDRKEMQRKARNALWGKGVADYMSILRNWRDKGTLDGLEITV
ncbi:flavin-binding monooxygenase-like family protein [Colletotrichum truncatum]|uniref:Flavin-binding monooxygenase-like family protein n=1 Tax=Colletotrichum truncatum TaxID=5467 RepID=A0ACC3Z7D8_COLTU|nr:flavin-binding monooxygenase-like family protein [Colletotrichum truncatum]KAF6782938.1 flavin-binding monooxygenase-like family protein [Colletotrichum truncatum]